MSDINFRIKVLRDHFAKGNNSDFASMIESNEANIRNYIKETEPKANILVNICEKLEVNAEWLLLGKGEMLAKVINSEEKFSDELGSNFKLSPEILKFLENYNKAFYAIQTIQDRKIEILTSNIENLKEYDVLINPATDTSGNVRTNNEGVVRKTQEILFDLSVSISKEEIDIEKDSKEGNARIQVVSLFNFSLGGNIKNESVDELNLKNTAINKIRFSIPVSFGTNKPGTTKGFSMTSGRL